MKFLIVTLLALFNLSIEPTITHDAVTATFNIVERGHVLMLEIDFNTQDFLKINKLKNKKISDEIFKTYLNKTTSWEIDCIKIIPSVLSIKSLGHHTKVICFLSKSYDEEIKSIAIKNEFLIAIESHINVIIIDINKTHRGFKMDKTRQEITIDY